MEMTVDGADEHIDKPAGRYMGVDSGPWRRTGEQRAMAKKEVEGRMRGSFIFRDPPYIQGEGGLPGSTIC